MTSWFCGIEWSGLMEPAELVHHLRRRRSMLGIRGGYDSVVAYLCGVKQGSGGGWLNGFQELVELKFGQTTSLGWPSLCLKLEPEIDPSDPDVDQQRIDRLLDLLDEYVTMDLGHSHQRLMIEWVVMNQAGRGFDPDLNRYSVSPAGPTLSIEEVAAELGCDTSGVWDLIRSGGLRAGREAGVVRIRQAELDRYRDASTADN